MSLEEQLKSFYRGYQQDHARKRDQLMAQIASLSSSRTIPFTGARERLMHFRKRLAYRAAIAAAAMLMLLVGSMVIFGPANKPAGVDMVWATALEQVGRVQSVHLRLSTCVGDSGNLSSLEMWWRRPGDFRMEFAGNGLVITGNSQQRCHYLPQNKTLTVYNTKEPGFEMAILGEFGELFASRHSRHSLTGGWVRESTLISTEPVVFKGEDCKKMIFARGDRYYECIVDAKGLLIYQGKIYDRSHPEKILQFIEILEIDITMPDDLFTVQPDVQMNVKNLR